MYPEIGFTLAGTRVVASSHALAVAVGVTAGFVLALRRARDATPAAAATAIAALVGAH